MAGSLSKVIFRSVSQLLYLAMVLSYLSCGIFEREILKSLKPGRAVEQSELLLSWGVIKSLIVQLSAELLLFLSPDT